MGLLGPLGAPKPSAPAGRSSQGRISLSHFGLVADLGGFLRLGTADSYEYGFTMLLIH